MRAQDAAREPVLATFPNLAGARAAHELRPERPHDRVVERQQRLVDAEVSPVSAKRIALAHDQAGVFEDGQGMRELVAFPAHVPGDAPAAGIT
jgi:hypothetical protein